MTGRDLGTYHVRVELADGRGWIQKWETGAQFTGGTGDWRPLDATLIRASYADEAALIQSVLWAFFDGNSSCDCNKALYLAYSLQQPDPDVDCGETMTIKEITVLRPDMSQIVIYPEKTA